MLGVSVTTIQLIHVIVISVCREHEKALKRVERDSRASGKGQEEMSEAQVLHATQWVKSVTPNKIVRALALLRNASESVKDGEMVGGYKLEIGNLADQVLENVTLIATQILSLKQWHYLKAD